MAIKEDRFIKTVVDPGGLVDNRLEVYVDRKTGVNYLFAQGGNAGGLLVEFLYRYFLYWCCGTLKLL